MEEVWKDIPNYEGLYQASNLGNIKVLDRIVNCGIKNNKTIIRKSRLLKQRINQGYYEVALSKNGKKRFLKVHRLIAITFIPNLNKLPSINHKDENKLNNCIDNLEWCTIKYNCNYGTRNKKIYKNNPFKHLKVELYDLNNNLLQTFNSVAEASRYKKCSSLTITRYCKGITKDKNYIWRYANK